jgi:hypothetical protein
MHRLWPEPRNGAFHAGGFMPFVSLWKEMIAFPLVFLIFKFGPGSVGHVDILHTVRAKCWLMIEPLPESSVQVESDGKY